MNSQRIAAGLRRALVLSALVWLGGLQRAEAGVDVWTTNGPGGGEIEALAIDPQNPATIYAAVRRFSSRAYSDLFKSTDAGGSWRAVAVGLPFVHALAVDPRTPTTLYLGGSGYLGATGGVYKSTDGGSRWTPMNAGLPVDSSSHLPVSAYRLVIDPQTPTTLYVGTFANGVFKSTNGGGSWHAVNTGLPTDPRSAGSYPAVDALAIDPLTPTTLYAANNLGLFKSTDGGGSWRPANNGLTGGTAKALAIDPQAPTTLYAAGAGIFKSTDGGATWHKASAGLPQEDPYWYHPVLLVVIDPRTPTTLYAATGSKLFKSTDGAGSWREVNTGLQEYFYPMDVLAIDPQTPTTLYLGTKFRGIIKSTDGGAGWHVVNNGLAGAHVVGMAIDPRTPTTLYASAWGQGLFKSTDGGGSWVNVAYPRPVGVLAIDPQTPTTLYAGGSGLVQKTTDGGHTWTSHGAGQFPSSAFGRQILSLAIDPLTPTTLYATSFACCAFKSTDGGQNWRAILSSSYTPALAVDPQTPTTLYAGRSTYAGGTTGYIDEILKSTDGGVTWSVINTGLGVGIFAIDPQTTSTLYASGVDRRTGSRGVFKSTDGGVSWRAINNGLTDSLVRALVIDPQTTSTLYAGTWNYYSPGSGGVFKSTDGGESWSAIGAGGTTLQVAALVIDPQTPTTLHAGTTMGVFTLQQGRVSVATTVSFDAPTPPGGPGPLDGVFEGIDFGTGQWAWEGPFGAGPTNHVYFASSTETSQSFAFTPAPRVLESVRVFSPTPGTLTLTDDAGQTHSSEITAGSMQLVTTGWTRPTTTVTVSFTNGWDLGVDDITYSAAP